MAESAVVTISDDPERAGGVIVDFDVADRCRAEVASLAATYLVRLGSSELRDAGAHAIAWADDRLGPGALKLESDAGATLALAEAGRRCTRAQALARLEDGSFTHRLRYRWCWARTPRPTSWRRRPRGVRVTRARRSTWARRGCCGTG